MKFIGRLSAVVPIITINYWLMNHIFHEDGLPAFIVSFLLSLLTTVIAWVMGGQYDKAKFYQEELLLNKQVLERQKEDYKQIFDSVDATIWSNDLESKKIYVSKGVEKMTGYTVGNFFDNYQLWLSIIHPDDFPKATHFLNLVLKGIPSNLETRYINASGETLWVYISGTPIFRKGTKEVIKINGVVLDISKMKIAEEMMRESENRYRNVVELSPNLILIYQKDKIIYANPATYKMLGMQYESELIGKSVYDFIHPSFKDLALYRSNEVSANKKDPEYKEYVIVKPNGESIYLEIAGVEISYNGKPAIFVVGNDVTARKESEEKIKFMAYHDALTGLPNRHMYNEVLEETLIRCKNFQKQMAVMVMDIDRFKFINDTMGHNTGDELLVQITKRLVSTVREGDLISRQGGDEFSVILEDAEQSVASRIAERILAVFSKPFILKDKSFEITASIGISLFPIDGDEKELLTSKADKAMYFAKKNGKNNYQFFYEHGKELVRSLEIEQDLGKAIETNEFYLNYQPCVELATGKIYCVEALVRWKHKTLGVLSPCEFIPIAEESGWIVQLGKWILNEACRQNKEWLDRGIKIKTAVNVSALQFVDRNFVQVVKEILQHHQLPQENLEIEITESVMQNFDISIETIHDLKQIGVRISIDDFGTGYSSLSVLSSLPIDHLKIDKSFVKEINSNPITSELVKQMIELGALFNFDLIAEGIEEKEQAEFLMEKGCRYGQGFYYSKPISPKELEPILMRNQK